MRCDIRLGALFQSGNGGDDGLHKNTALQFVRVPSPIVVDVTRNTYIAVGELVGLAIDLLLMPKGMLRGEGGITFEDALI